MMIDDKKKPGNYDPDKINVNDNLELKRWADKFDVTKVKLKAAVNAAGNSAIAVEAYLKRAKK